MALQHIRQKQSVSSRLWATCWSPIKYLFDWGELRKQLHGWEWNNRFGKRNDANGKHPEKTQKPQHKSEAKSKKTHLSSVLASHPKHSWSHPRRVWRISILSAPPKWDFMTSDPRSIDSPLTPVIMLCLLLLFCLFGIVLFFFSKQCILTNEIEWDSAFCEWH